ncbi:MAG: DNA cytosine methyltransferase [Campylobacter sp.]|nr:DNA cytosine methyltransferase [Campylobacter sp.]
MTYKIADIFCGAGGLSYGFSKNDKFEIVFANDIDKDAVNSYKANHKNTAILCKDIANLSQNEIEKFRQIDILLGGPPCQSYSTLGKRQMDSRANLFKEYLRILKILSPKMFIFENVRGILSMQGGKLFKQICAEFENLDYKTDYKILNAAEFGVPQIRERVLLVGTKKGEFKFPRPTHGENERDLSKFISLKEAIDDLPIIGSGENGNDRSYRHAPNNEFLKFVRNSSNLTEHSSPKNNPNLIKIMQTLKDGECKDDLPPEIRPKSGYTNTYAKMWWNRPAPTITRNFATPSSSRCIHPRDSRALSIREGARLQSFPDDYAFCGSDQSKRLQIGNAVPPLLSIALSKSVLEFLGENYV